MLSTLSKEFVSICTVTMTIEYHQVVIRIYLLCSSLFNMRFQV